MERTSGIEHSRIRRIHKERVASDGSYTSRAENREVLADFDVNGMRKERIGRYYDDENRSFSQGLVRNRIQGDYSDLNMNRPEYVHFQSGQERFVHIPYHGEGPSSYEMSPHYEYVERTRYRDRDSNMFAGVENLGHDQVELLMKLDELKDQLSRSCMEDKHKERMVSLTPPDPYRLNHNVYVQEGLTSSHVVEKQSFAEDDLEAPYLSHIYGGTPSTGRYVSGVQDSYPPRDFPHEFKEYPDTDQQKMLRRPPWQPPSHYLHQPYHDDFPGYYRDSNHDLFMLPPHTNFLHQPPCSCVHCSSRNLYIPPKIDPYRFPHEPHNSKFHLHLNPILHVPQGYSSGDSNLNKLHSRQSPTLKSSDLNNESDSLNYHRARKLAVAHRSRSVCHPIARGAPFVTCCNCFELLKLPKKHVSSTKIQKMKCGACFSVISFELGNTGYPKSVSAQVEPVLNEIDNGSSETINEHTRDCNGDSYNADMKVCSNNYDDSKIKSSPIDSKSNSGKSEKQLDALSSTSSISKDEHSLDNATSEIHCSSSAKLPSTMVEPFPISDFSQKCPDHCSDNNTVSQFDEGNTNSRSEPALDRNTSLQVPINDAVMATNIDVSINVFSNSCMPQDFVEIIREDHQGVIEGSLENVTSQIHCSSSAELPSTMVEAFPRSDCSQKCPDHYSDNNTVSQFDEGNTSNRSEPALNRSTSLQVPINDAVMATNIDVSVNVFSNSYMSQDYVEISREDHQGVIEGGQCFYEGLKKKIFQDFSESNQSSKVDRSKVFVNGHFIPDRDVKKAEKLAGPIQPGEYWYDIIAGFWGVMGHPCLGIIMPNIQEFNYPLPEKCAAGNTGVFVNGRELHQKDLDMLACRGLSILKNRYYFVEISGKVIDEQTGEELDGLGKLAPTVEREKHGFGMRVP